MPELKQFYSEKYPASVRRRDGEVGKKGPPGTGAIHSTTNGQFKTTETYSLTALDLEATSPQSASSEQLRKDRAHGQCFRSCSSLRTLGQILMVVAGNQRAWTKNKINK